MIPVSLAVTLEMVAANVTLLAPDGTVTFVGTFIAEMLLERCTLSPPFPAAMSVCIVHESEPAPVTSA